ncbi:MAG: SMI1/KNR4 family protein [Anaerofustis sp.]
MIQQWKNNIVTMIYVKEELHKYDINGLWQYHFPEVAATEEQIESVERKLGYKLDANYRSFLTRANGWKGFYQTVDLFGTEEIVNSSIMKYANKLLDSLEEDVIRSSGFLKSELMPIATTLNDKDLFVLTIPTSHKPGIVIWFAGEEIDRFSDFNEYFLAMIDYNREEIEDLKKENSK